jgi:hypothetical protein
MKSVYQHYRDQDVYETADGLGRRTEVSSDLTLDSAQDEVRLHRSTRSSRAQAGGRLS